MMISRLRAIRRSMCRLGKAKSMLGCRRAAILFPLAWLLLFPGCSRPSLQRRVSQLAGPEATDCGYTHERTWWKVNPCLVAAFRANRPFFVRYQGLGIDSNIEWAVVHTRDGKSLRLDFDSDVRGSGSALFAKPRLTENICVPRLGRPLHDTEDVFMCEVPEIQRVPL